MPPAAAGTKKDARPAVQRKNVPSGSLPRAGVRTSHDPPMADRTGSRVRPPMPPLRFRCATSLDASLESEEQRPILCPGGIGVREDGDPVFKAMKAVAAMKWRRATEVHSNPSQIHEMQPRSREDTKNARRESIKMKGLLRVFVASWQELYQAGMPPLQKGRSPAATIHCACRLNSTAFSSRPAATASRSSMPLLRA